MSEQRTVSYFSWTEKSENAEEQPNTGVLGRIGSWLSPWRGKGPRSTSESLSPSDEPDLKLAGEAERSDECGREPTEKQQKGGESSSLSPSSLALSRDDWLSREQDATQSSHRDNSAVCSTESEEGGPAGEECINTRKRTGQSSGREEKRNSILESGNPEKNASHVTPQFSFSKQGVLWDPGHTQRPVQRKKESEKGKKIQVYLEESVIECGKGTDPKQEVVRTKVDQSLPIRRPKLLASVESEKGTVRKATPSNGTESFPSAREGVFLRQNRDTQFKADTEKKQTEADSMGRKNTARRKSRKCPQSEAGSSQHDKKSLNSEKGSPLPGSTASSAEGKSPKAEVVNSSSVPSPTSQLSPELKQRKTSCADVVKLDKLPGADAASGATPAQGMDGVADKEDDDSAYRVERKTETPESKRRSMKMSRSEIKFFPKRVRLNPKKDEVDNNSTFSKIEDKGSSEPISGIEPKEPTVKKIEEEQKPQVNRIADKINLFERSAVQIKRQAFQIPRSADVSPVRRATHKLNENVLQQEQRSRSAERYEGARSSGSSPLREKTLSIEQRKNKFFKASKGLDTTTALPPKSEMTGMSKRCTSPVTVAGSNARGPDTLDAKEQIQASVTPDVSLKLDVLDEGKGEGKSVFMSEENAANTKLEDNADLKSANQGEKPRSETEVSASEPENSQEFTKKPGSQSKDPCLKDLASFISPTGPIQADLGKNQEPVGQIFERTPLPEKPLGSLPNTHSLSESKLNVPVVPDKLEKQPSSSFTEDSTVKPVRREEAKAHVNEDEPDIAAASTRTKPPLDKEVVILPPKEEATVGQRLPFTQEAADPRKGKEAPSSDSSLLKEQVDREEKPPVELPQPNRDNSVDSEQKTEEKDDSNKNTTPPLQFNGAKPIDGTKGKDLKSDREGKTEDKESWQQNLLLNKSVKESDRVEIVGEGAESGTFADDKKNAQHSQAETGKSEAATPLSTLVEASIPITQQQHNGDGTATYIQNGKPDKEDSTETQCQKEPPMGETNFAPKSSSENSDTAVKQSAVIAVDPQLEPILTGQRDKTPSDSYARGANGVQLSLDKPEAVKAASGETVGAITTHKVTDRGSFTGESTPICSAQSVSSEEAGCDDGKNTSDGILMPPLPTLRAVSSLKNTQLPSDGIAIGAEGTKKPTTIPTTTVAAEKTPQKPSHLLISDMSPIFEDKGVPKNPARDSLKRDFPKFPASTEGNRSPQRSSPRGLSRDDSAVPHDAPSSWLDVDLPVRKLKIAPRKLSYSGSESNLLDTSDDLDDEDFVERIKKLCAPFSAPLRKHNPLKPPQPTFAMPAIREDRFEKTFDPNEFTFGLRKSTKYTIDSTLNTLAKMQSFDTKAGLRPARASLADRSILLSSLDTQSRLKSPDKEEDGEEEEGAEEKEEKVKVRSRLEGSCVLSSLKLNSRMKREALSSQVDGTITTGPASPSEAPALSSPPPAVSQPLPSSPTVIAPVKAAAEVEQGHTAGGGDQEAALQPVVSDSCPPLPSFNDIKLPDFLEKYRNQEAAKPAASTERKEPVKMELTEEKPPQTSKVEAVKAMKPGPPPSVPPSIPVNPPTKNQTPTKPRQPPAKPQAVFSTNFKKRVAKGFHKRPGKLVLFERAQFAGQAYEISRDVADTTSLQLSPLISVKVVRGCWLLYEKPDFQGRTVALEEGVLELSNMWSDAEQQIEAQIDKPVLIGSIRLVVCDYSMPHIDLFTEPEGRGRVTPYQDDTVETGSFGIPLSTASVQVHSGVWLVFSDPGFQGMLAVLETGVYPYPESWGFPSPFVGSLRPLKMGVIKVENASEVKALVYEKPGFQGSVLEVDGDVFSFWESEAGFSAANAHVDSKNLKSVGSIKVIGGLWVGYSEPGFEGQQHILEEGEYLDCGEWGGSEQLLSLQPVLSDFFSPHLKMFRDPSFGERGGSVDLTMPVINLEEMGYGTRTQSIDVVSGVWVVFEEAGFCGEPHILERGLYGCPEDWGALQPRLGSAMTVVLEDIESTAKFKVQLFSEPAFQGSVLGLEDSAASLQNGFSVASCKVLAGSWLAFECQDFTGRMYVLEAGSYPDLRAMGCSQGAASILSMQTIGFEFSLPSITLFERRGLRGKRVVLTDCAVNLQLAGGCARVQSLLVEGGMWVLYECINYRGAQLLLRPGEVPDWREISTWQRIGSLRPLAQPQVHFRIRNRQTGLMMAVTGDLDDIKLMRIQETEESGELDQIWIYQNGRLHCKLLEECFLTPSGSIVIAGGRVGLSAQEENHLWSITTEGFICYSSTPGLVLDVKGGHHYDKNQVILNTMDPNKEHQLWDVELL